MQDTIDLALMIHLSGAAVTGVLLILTVGGLITKRVTWFRKLTIGLALIGAFQLVSGTLLSYLSHSTLNQFCTNIGLYLGLLVVAELSLMWALQKRQMKFPVAIPVTALVIGLAPVAGFILTYAK